ncbi:MAG: N-acetyltransferase family protein [Campylobacterales bacterium]
MIIRPAEPKDVDALVELAKVNTKESRFERLPFDEGRVRFKVGQMIARLQSSNFFAVACKGDGTVIGYQIGYIEEYFFCSKTVAASVFLFVHPDYRGGLAAPKLIMAFRSWAKNRGAAELYIGIAGGVEIEKSGRFLQKMGLQLTGGNYSAWL